MKSIAFLDTEVDFKERKIRDIGSITDEEVPFHSGSIEDLKKHIYKVKYVCGHNIIKHDLIFLKNYIKETLEEKKIIDTLYLSPLLFPQIPYHALIKDDKLQTEELNNPLNDAIKTRALFHDEISAFQRLNKDLKQIYFQLLKDTKEFCSFFDFIGYNEENSNVISMIQSKFSFKICENTDFNELIGYPVELAYCLALINTDNRYSITPPWVGINYPEVERIMCLLRSNPCSSGCRYCNQFLDAKKGLKKFFGFDSYRTYEGKPLQENAVNSALIGNSILAVFPTGGGKSITFQVPALISGENVKGLTIVISPLQSLMKDQVDNLEKSNITEAVTINGLLDPIERGKSFERVKNGTASILYISPESLRSKTIEKLILGRNVVRFVIDEAHCFSCWGQDFRVDYLYIGDFIKSIQEKKSLKNKIPVSCFTATAKPKVIKDICNYFQEKLAISLEIFRTKTSRANLNYKVLPGKNDDEKYRITRNLLDGKNCPSIIYVSKTKRAYDLAQRLSGDGYPAKPYHGKMDKKEKSENQDGFIKGKVKIIVATSAFGMGVDKKDVGLVVHYEISNSLENYIQEAGRAGRDENITADCYVLFDEEDLNKHFILLNQTRLNFKEIGQVWNAIKEVTHFRSSVSNSALEIARKAGWDDNVYDIETRVITAISALEEAGYIKRGQNMPRIFASSILSKNAIEAIEKIENSRIFNERQRVQAVRIIRKLFSSKSSKHSNDDDEAESRVDYISDHLGIVKEEVINVINLLREEGILADSRDITAFIKRGEKINKSLKLVNTFGKIEEFLLSELDESEKNFNLKELNVSAENYGCTVSPDKIQTLINFWSIKNWLKRKGNKNSRDNISISLNSTKEELREKIKKRHEMALFIVEFLYLRCTDNSPERDNELVFVEFSVHELKNEYERSDKLFKYEVKIEDIEEALFYLSRIGALKIEGGFLVLYNRLTIERLEKDNKKRYKKDDYTKLAEFYKNKMQQIHIVGEYAKKMIHDYQKALQFVDDYFQENYDTFLQKYFKGDRKEDINQNLTPDKFKQLFGDLSPSQLEIIKDRKSQYIAVLAGPGSGKTRILVHKLASLLLMEDVKHEQLLMITFSRASATEFKKRLLKLIGNAANRVEIKTFHSYCFDLLGKIGSIEESETVITKAVEKIKKNDIEHNRIAKTVLVIDEAQDMNKCEFDLITTLMDKNDDMRVIAVGDDDQNVYEFRGSSSKYLETFITEKNATKYELRVNFRSKSNLVEFCSKYVLCIKNRLKEFSLLANTSDNGNIKLVKYRENNLVVPLVKDVIESNLSKTICILTKTNKEALLVTGLLIRNGVQAKLIQSNDSFQIYNMREIRYFINLLNNNRYTISSYEWNLAKQKFREKHKKSSKYEICISIINEFERSNPTSKFRQDLIVFIKESKLEDFFQTKMNTIFVSTIHKSKGKEFDNVFILLNNFNPSDDEKKRQLYVAMTRAKENLFIHTNENYLDEIYTEDLKIVNDNNRYEAPETLIINLTFKDIWLDYFISNQKLISRLSCGDSLFVNNNGCYDNEDNLILKFSKLFINEIGSYIKMGYELKKARVDYLIYWKKENKEEETIIILPELQFEKTSLNQC